MIGILLLVGVVRVRATLEISGRIFMVIKPSSLIVAVTDNWMPMSTKVTSSLTTVLICPLTPFIRRYLSPGMMCAVL